MARRTTWKSSLQGDAAVGDAADDVEVVPPGGCGGGWRGG